MRSKKEHSISTQSFNLTTFNKKIYILEIGK